MALLRVSRHSFPAGATASARTSRKTKCSSRFRRDFPHLMPVYAYAILLAGIAAWFTPFVFAHRKATAANTVDQRSRWRVLLQFVAFTLLWQGHFWTRQLPPWRLVICVVLFGLAILLSWTSSSALGRHLRVDAALGAEHQLIRSGPYGLVRNPIYTSMLLVLCATAVVVTPWQSFAA